MRVTWAAFFNGDFGHNMWVLETLGNWKVLEVVFQHDEEVDVKQSVHRYYEKIKSEGSIDPVAQHTADGAGKSRAFSVEQVLAEDHWMRRMHTKYGIKDRMIAAYTQSESSESLFWIDRGFDQDLFTESDKQRAVEILGNFPRLHYWMLLERGLTAPATRPLSPREKEVLRHLLGPKDESTIADEMGLARGTVHNYVTDIYSVYQVNSRYELLHLWISNSSIYS